MRLFEQSLVGFEIELIVLETKQKTLELHKLVLGRKVCTKQVVLLENNYHMLNIFNIKICKNVNLRSPYRPSWVSMLKKYTRNDFSDHGFSVGVFLNEIWKFKFGSDLVRILLHPY